jgi:DNA-binding beta-propeller fold protein YncE
VIAVNPDGSVLRSFGKGLYGIPHAIRVDPDGNVWTTDAATSHVIKFSPSGRKLLQIAVGGQPDRPGPFRGSTDIASPLVDGSSSAMVMATRGYLNLQVRGGR